MALGDKSFSELTVKELRPLAEMFAVDLGNLTKKADIIKEIEENGVTFEMYAATLEPEEEDPIELTLEDDSPLELPEPVVEEEEESDKVLVKMVRQNHSYEVLNYKFSRTHPFVLVSEDDADYLVEKDGGFRIATPRELREFYGA